MSSYAANDLNQYTRISTNGENFTPEYDADGNQTLIQTSTGIWKVQYNGQNRAVRFESEDGRTVITCGYDYMGRRFEKKVVTNGTTTLHERYIYRGYLQIAAYDLREGHAEHPDLRFIVWDPTQEVATRPLAIRENGVWYTYGWDLTKNICELYGQEGFIRTIYTYSPYGQVTAEGDVIQPIQWSSEMYDAELGLVYYNYRYYNPRAGRWTRREPLEINYYYRYCNNSPIDSFDLLGLKFCHKEVIVNHFDDKMGDNNNKLRKGDIAVGHYEHQQIPKLKDSGVLPYKTKVKVHVYGYGSFEGKVADRGGFDKKDFNRKKHMKPEDWIDVWDPEKSRKSITRKGCIETEVKDGCPCPRRYSEGRCPQREDGKDYWDDGK